MLTELPDRVMPDAAGLSRRLATDVLSRLNGIIMEANRFDKPSHLAFADMRDGIADLAREMQARRENLDERCPTCGARAVVTWTDVNEFTIDCGECGQTIR